MELKTLVTTFRIVRIGHSRVTSGQIDQGRALCRWNNETVWLPGYECQMGQNAEQHSRQKLLAASAAISPLTNGVTVDKIWSPAKECQVLGSGGGDLSRIETTMSPITSHPTKPKHNPVCLDQAYRCCCAFQILRLSACVTHTDTSALSADRLVYARRDNFKPNFIGSDVFPVANPRIQRAMSAAIKFLREADAVGCQGNTCVLVCLCIYMPG